MATIAEVRREYARETLSEGDVLADPIAQFVHWFAQAQTAEVLEPNAMTLATADSDGQPSARIVLLKGVDERGFTFFTDYRSHKAADLDAVAKAALCLYWKEIERQVRITGAAERVSQEESRAYFETRPRGSQIGAWSSWQSSVLSSRADLEAVVAASELRFGQDVIPCPDHWGGYRVRPDKIEFWQGRLSRLHDRIVYCREGEGWVTSRLSP